MDLAQGKLYSSVSHKRANTSEYSMKQAVKIAVRFLVNWLPLRFKRYLLSILTSGFWAGVSVQLLR